MAVIWTKKSKGVIVLDIETNPFTCGWIAPESGKTYMDYPLDIRVAVVYSYDDDTYHTFGPEQQNEFFEMVNAAKRVVSFNGEGFDFLVMQALGFMGEISDSVDLCHRIKEYTGSNHFTSLDSIAKEHFGRRKQTKGRDMVNLDYEKLAEACRVDVEITKQIYENRQHWKKNSAKRHSRRNFDRNEPEFSETENLVFKALKMSREYTPEWMNWAKNHLRKVIYKDKFNWLPEEIRTEILTTLKVRLNNTVSEYTQWQKDKSAIWHQTYWEYQPKIDALRQGSKEWREKVHERSDWIQARMQELMEGKYTPEQLEKFTQMENDRELIWMLLRNLNSLYYISPEYISELTEHDITRSTISSPFVFDDKTHWSYIHRTPKMQYAKNLNYHHGQNKRRHRVNHRITDVVDKYPDCKSMMCDYYYAYYQWKLEWKKSELKSENNLKSIREKQYESEILGMKQRPKTKNQRITAFKNYFIDRYTIPYQNDFHLINDPNFDFDCEHETLKQVDSWNDNLAENGLPKTFLDRIKKVVEG